MSGSETGPFTVGLHKPPQQQPQQLQNMRLDYTADGAAIYKPLATVNPTYHPLPSTTVTAATVNINGAGASSGAGRVGESSSGILPHGQGVGHVGSSESMKKKRGRPRKYGPDGTMALGLNPAPPAMAVNHSTEAFSPVPSSAPPSAPPTTPPSAPPSAATPNLNRKRGRPRGSGNKHQLKSLGSAGVSFTPHVVIVKAGEDLSAKIMSLSHFGPRSVFILTANGAISTVTLRQPESSGGTVTYEGRFEILSLAGSLLINQNSASRNRTGGLSVSLSGPDGRVLGGGVAGLLIAASPVQVVLGSFIPEGHKVSSSAKQVENLPVPPNVSTAGQSSSPSRVTLSESSGGPGSPLNQSSAACNNNNPQGISSMPWK